LAYAKTKSKAAKILDGEFADAVANGSSYKETTQIKAPNGRLKRGNDDVTLAGSEAKRQKSHQDSTDSESPEEDDEDMEMSD
jgi:hypothetical protein